MNYRINNQQDLIDLIEEWGFVPFFANAILGFSIEENIRPDLWFSDTQEDPWEWKEPVIRTLDCAYGKFMRGKAVYITREWFLDYANYRRDGYDLDARYDDGLLQNRDKVVYKRSPEESRDRMITHLAGLFPAADERAICKMIG